jgi:hypothetical protein
MDYAVPTFYHALPQYFKNELIRVEKRAISIINPAMDYPGGNWKFLNIRQYQPFW